MNRILLINPPLPDRKVWIREGRCQQWDIWGAPFPPLSLAMISTQLKKVGNETLIIDSGPARKGIQAVLSESRAFDPTIAILTSSSPTIQSDLHWFAGELKETLPAIKIAAVGIHVSALPEKVLQRFPSVDFIVMGEPEIVSKELVSAVLEGRPLEFVQGIAYRNELGVVHVNPSAGFIDDIDTLGFPDWGKINFSNYLLPIIKRPFSMISFSRGCPFFCKFCTTHIYYGRKLRKRSIANLTEEIKYNLSFGVKDFLFWTELMTGDYAYLDRFLDTILRENLQKQIKWVCNSRVDGISDELVRKMKKAGCWQIALGIEFGDDEMLEKALKGGNATVAQSRIAVETVHRAGIAVDGQFLLGYPGETIESMQKTIDFACSLPLTFAHFYAVVPFPGSPLYGEALENGWFDPANWDNLRQDTATLEMETLDSQTVNRYIEKAYRNFYLDPKVIMRICTIPKSLREYSEAMKVGLKFYHLLLKKSS